jgi:hypothetical protein
MMIENIVGINYVALHVLLPKLKKKNREKLKE